VTDSVQATWDKMKGPKKSGRRKGEGYEEGGSMRAIVGRSMDETVEDDCC